MSISIKSQIVKLLSTRHNHLIYFKKPLNGYNNVIIKKNILDFYFYLTCRITFNFISVKKSKKLKAKNRRHK